MNNHKTTINSIWKVAKADHKSQLYSLDLCLTFANRDHRNTIIILDFVTLAYYEMQNVQMTVNDAWW